MRLFLKRIGFVLLLFFSISMCVAVGSLWSLRQSSFYKPSFLVNSVQDKEFDYIILGSSTGLTTLNTQVIDSVLDIDGINLSMDNTALSSQYLMLQHFLAQGKKTKYCVLAPSAVSFDAKNKDISDNDYRFLPYASVDYIHRYYSSFSSQPAQLLSYSKWFPVLGVSYFNTELFYPSIFSFFQPEKRNRFDAKGNYTYPLKNNEDIAITTFKALPVFFENKFVKKINDLCVKNKIQLICYFSPIKGRQVIAESANYTIINHSDLLTNNTLFYDVIHVNTKGRQVASESFARNLKSLWK
jgi:hypothetical protein